MYRAQDELVYADPVERRSMAQHLARLLASGRVEEVEPGRLRISRFESRRPDRG